MEHFPETDTFQYPNRGFLSKITSLYDAHLSSTFQGLFLKVLYINLILSQRDGGNVCVFFTLLFSLNAATVKNHASQFVFQTIRITKYKLAQISGDDRYIKIEGSRLKVILSFDGDMTTSIATS